MVKSAPFWGERRGKINLDERAGGIYSPTEGTITIDGEKVMFHNAKDAEKKGIAFIHQELSLFPQMDIASNIYISNLPNTKGMILSKNFAKALRKS